MSSSPHLHSISASVYNNSKGSVRTSDDSYLSRMDPRVYHSSVSPLSYLSEVDEQIDNIKLPKSLELSELQLCVPLEQLSHQNNNNEKNGIKLAQRPSSAIESLQNNNNDNNNNNATHSRRPSAPLNTTWPNDLDFQLNHINSTTEKFEENQEQTNNDKQHQHFQNEENNNRSIHSKSPVLCPIISDEHYREYDISIVDLTDTNETNSQIAKESLKIEGCAVCLSNQIFEDDNRCALLSCQLLQCSHVIHMNCFQQSNNLNTHQDNGVISKTCSDTPVRIDTYHSTLFFRVLSFSSVDPASQIPNSDIPGDRSFRIELSVTHHISNSRMLHMLSPSAVSTMSDRNSELEYFVFTPPVTNTIDSSDSSTTVSNYSFRNLRGRIRFCCQSVENEMDLYEQGCNYDLSSAPSNNDNFRLVHVDAHTRNVLTLGIRRQTSNNGNDDTMFTITYVRFQFGSIRKSSPNIMIRSPGDNSHSTGSISSRASPEKAGDDEMNYPVSATLSPHYEPLLPKDLISNIHERSLVEDANSGYGESQTGPITTTNTCGSSSSPRSMSGVNPFGTHSGSLLSHSSSSTLASLTGSQPHSSILSSMRHHSQSPPNFSLGSNQRRSSMVPMSSQLSRELSGPNISEHQSSQLNSGYNSFNPHSSVSNDERTIPPPFYRTATDWHQQDTINEDDRKSYSNQSSDYQDFESQSDDRATPRIVPERHNFMLRDQRKDRREWDQSGNTGLHRQMNNDQQINDFHHFQHNFEGSPLYLPALPTFPNADSNSHLMPPLNLSLDQVRGNVIRLAKSHSGSRFIQQRLDARDIPFFQLFYTEMAEHVPELMVDNFGHFAIEKLISSCDDEQCLHLLQKLAPAISIVACQKHGSFSVQALVDTLHTPAQIYTLVEAMRADIMRIITHASGHFVVLRMLQRFPYQSTKFIDDAIVANCAQIGTDHHGLRVVKAVLAVRRPSELTRLFKQVARLTMKLVENQYGNYVIQAVLDVAPPGVRTNIKVKMEGKYMRLSKQKFSSNVVEKCLKQSSSHWRMIIIRELTAQPAVSELLRDRYGNYVLQTALSVSNSAQVQEILKAITPYLPSLRDNVRSKWKKMLKKAGAQLLHAPMGSHAQFDEELTYSPASSSAPASPRGYLESPVPYMQGLDHGNQPNSLSLNAQNNMNFNGGLPYPPLNSFHPQSQQSPHFNNNFNTMSSFGSSLPQLNNNISSTSHQSHISGIVTPHLLQQQHNLPIPPGLHHYTNGIHSHHLPGVHNLNGNSDLQRIM